MLTKEEQSKKLNELIGNNIKDNSKVIAFNLLFSTILSYSIVGCMEFNSTVIIVAIALATLFIPSSYSILDTMKNIVAKIKIDKTGYSYSYVTINDMQSSSCYGLTVKFMYKNKIYENSCNNYKARKVHIFDFGKFIISSVEEEKDLVE